jgi:hypothetical protein
MRAQTVRFVVSVRVLMAGIAPVPHKLNRPIPRRPVWFGRSSAWPAPGPATASEVRGIAETRPISALPAG